MLITSPANERLKQARRVRDGREPNLIFVEGERLAEDCLQARLSLTACFHMPEPSPRAQAILEKLDCPGFAVAENLLATISDTVNTQGLILLAERPSATLDEVLNRQNKNPLLVCLDGIQDPGNFGTILRTAEAAGAGGVISLKGSADAFAPKTLRSAMGSAFRLPVTANINPKDFLKQAHAAGLKVIAAAGDGETVYSDFDWRQPAALILGNEANGVRQELLESCDARLNIPMRPPVESLNVAAAAAAILFEAARQRR
ncbi:MAG TPA: RNA methyltransferase [Blastocatellia bacterium]|nr:RNA methyltransferase [Blastocatellia bacterium]HMX25144.1 RNA methyltransferase [Blastocatellia bacterium]HMY73319.1 RNA methyltransferase [Blastocatellia bacterium]HMZ21496.1 RNA methyltransferase [Blastocatellia bacterium]HNG32199.1 RNA methyltransferase [Blastocatellia bacterium]